jgi:hypothetical protein
VSKTGGGKLQYSTDIVKKSKLHSKVRSRVPYFPAYKTHHDFFVRNFREREKKKDECILILVIYWQKKGLLHTLLQESKPFTSSDARSHDLEANFTISR